MSKVFEKMLLSLKKQVLEILTYNHALSDSEFNSLALEIFEFQRRANPIYKKFVDQRIANKTLSNWIDIPALSTTAFKLTPVTSFDHAISRGCFHTSGTTESESGKHYFYDFELYNAAILPTFKEYVLPDLKTGERITMAVLVASPTEAPTSSLSHMMGVVKDKFGTAQSDYYYQNTRFDYDRLIQKLSESETIEEPIALLGTAFSFAFFMEELKKRNNRKFHLPNGSRIMDTGGFKGRTREIERDVFYRIMSERFRIPMTHIVNEYGMTELSSQFYDRSLVDMKPSFEKVGSSWAKIVIRDPLSLEPTGEGIVTVVDLANLYSLSAVATGDWGKMHKNGIEICGRAPGEMLRGCSLRLDS